MKEVQINERLPLKRAIPLGLQHLFAMFGATVLVPFLTGLSPSVALFSSGVGTIIFLLFTKSKIPAYLGSSFAYIGALTYFVKDSHNLPSAMCGVLTIGLVYMAIYFLLVLFGTKWINKLVPPVVAGSVVAIIGLSLTPTAVSMASTNWIIAIFTLSVAIIVSIYAKGFAKIIPILIAIVAGYILSACMGLVNGKVILVSFSTLFVLPFTFSNIGVYHFSISPVLIFLPIAFVTIVEDLGHMIVLGNITHSDPINDPGFDRVVLGNGVATIVASFFGCPPVTSYGENIGVLAVTKVYSTFNLWIAGFAAILLSMFNPLRVIIMSISSAVMGGVVILLFGMIAAAGLRTLVESKIDFSKMKNLIIVAVIFALGVGISSGSNSLAIASVVGIVLNLILKDKEEIEED